MTFDTISSVSVFKGRIFNVQTDRVRMPEGNIEQRDVVKHLDAVAVVALNDNGEIALVRQWRQPLRDYVIELPAGLMDLANEKPYDTALRELREETGVVAGTLRRLVTVASSPGFTDELVEVFLGADLSYVGRPAGEDEESDLTVMWVNLKKATDMIWEGRIISAHTVAGILATMTQGFLAEREA